RIAAGLAAQVVELGPVHVADRDDLDPVDLGRVQGKRSLDPNAERLLPDGERLACARSLPLEHDPFEHLDPLPLALDHAEMDADGVTGLEGRDVAQLGTLETLDDLAHRKKARRPTEDASEPALGSTRSVERDPAGRPVRGEHLADEILPRHEPPDARGA